MLLYTDGLVERPDTSLDEGLEWLRGFAAGVPAHPDELCGALLQARFRDAPPRDDVALLAVRLEPVPGSGSSSRCGPSPSRWRRCAARSGAGCARPAPSDTETYETLVASGEACANAIAHAYPPGEASYVVEARAARAARSRSGCATSAAGGRRGPARRAAA